MRSLVLASCLLAGCLGTETGNPPMEPVIDVSKIQLVEVEGTVRFTGAPGAIRPGGATARLVNLDTVTPLVQEAVDASGAFTATVLGNGANVIRLQARAGDLRSAPIDFALVAVPSTISACLGVVAHADFGSVSRGSTSELPLGMINGCGGDVMVMNQRFRAGDPQFAYRGPMTPFVLADGERTTLDLALTPSAAGEVEEVLLFDVAGPDGLERVAITLYGEGT